MSCDVGSAVEMPMCGASRWPTSLKVDECVQFGTRAAPRAFKNVASPSTKMTPATTWRASQVGVVLAGAFLPRYKGRVLAFAPRDPDQWSFEALVEPRG